MKWTKIDKTTYVTNGYFIQKSRGELRWSLYVGKPLSYFSHRGSFRKLSSAKQVAVLFEKG